MIIQTPQRGAPQRRLEVKVCVVNVQYPFKHKQALQWGHQKMDLFLTMFLEHMVYLL
jgi:hypothetical protein